METPNIYIYLLFSYFYNKNKVLIYFKIIRDCKHFYSLVLAGLDLHYYAPSTL